MKYISDNTWIKYTSHVTIMVPKTIKNYNDSLPRAFLSEKKFRSLYTQYMVFHVFKMRKSTFPGK